MLTSLKDFVVPPIFTDEDQTRNVRLAYILILATLALNILSIILDYLFISAAKGIELNLVIFMIQVVMLILVRRGYAEQVGMAFTIIIWVSITLLAYSTDGLTNPIIVLYTIPILTAGLLINVRAGLIVTTVSIITTLALAVAAERGSYPLTASNVPLGMRLGHYVTVFAFTGVTLYVSIGTIRSALAGTRATEAQLRESNQRLQAESEERARIQKALEASELRWRFALEGSDTGVWDMDLESDSIYRSPRYLELLRYSAEDVAAIKDTRLLFHPDDRERVQNKRNQYLNNEILSYEEEIRVFCGDGIYRWFSYRGKISEYKEDGSPKRFMGTLGDITARKQMEETIRVSEQAYRNLFENNPNPMWVYDNETSLILAVNDAAIHLYGYSRNEYAAMSFWDLLAQTEIERLEQRLAGGQVLFSAPDLWTHRTKRGEHIQVEVSAHATVFQDRVGRLVMVRDMTTQKETEESLRTSQELFARIFNNVPVGVSLSRITDGNFISVNPYLATMLDYGAEEMIGHSSTELKMLDSTSRTQYIQDIHTQNPPVGKAELKLKTRTGRNVDVLASTQVVKVSGEDALLSIMVDVTSIKRAERERMQIEILQSELDNQREVVELKERFISGVSHEFRNPLTIILSGTGILRLHDNKFTSEQRIERLQKIETQIHYLSDLLDRVLTISKARAGKFQFQPHEMDIVHFCRELFEDFRLSDNNRHEFIFQATGDFNYVHMDAKLIQHILMNLISNAVKYSSEGKAVKMQLQRDNNDVVIEVIDQGIGIPQEEQNQVFEPFFRSKNAENTKGTGLGLSITKESVEAHQGNITWHSQAGIGTTFIVRLPGGFQPVRELASSV